MNSTIESTNKPICDKMKVFKLLLLKTHFPPNLIYLRNTTRCDQIWPSTTYYDVARHKTTCYDDAVLHKTRVVTWRRKQVCVSELPVIYHSSDLKVQTSMCGIQCSELNVCIQCSELNVCIQCSELNVCKQVCNSKLKCIYFLNK